MTKRAEWLPKLTNEQHHDGSAATSTFLKALASKSPAHAIAKRNNHESTDALEFGIRLHTCVLEPEEFERCYMVAQQCSAIKKDKAPCKNSAVMISSDDGLWTCGVHSRGKTWSKAHAGIEVIDPDVRDRCLYIRDSIMANPPASELLAAKDCISEVTGEVEVVDGIIVRVRPDARSKTMGVIGDLKSTQDCRHDPFLRSCVNFDYPFSAAMYEHNANLIDGDGTYHTWWWIAAEKAPPYAVMVWEAPRDIIDHALMRYEEAIEVYSKCVDRDEWPTYSAAGILDFPDWAFK
jgi:hypothetical protein